MQIKWPEKETTHQVFLFRVYLSYISGVQPYRQGRHIVARKKIGDKQAKNKNTADTQTGNHSVAIGGINIGRDVTGEVNIATSNIFKGYTAEQVSVLINQITSTFQPKPFDGRCPYKGLDVFEEEDADLFFGRERLVDDLVQRVKESRTLFITGPSGCGKSSLVRAGLIPALKQGAIANLHTENWLYETIKPGRNPIVELAQVVSHVEGTSGAGEDILTKGMTDATVLSQICESILKASPTKRFVLFVDQFQEIFTQVSKESERLAFLNLLIHAATVENGRLIVLFAMRSEFLSCSARVFDPAET